MNTERIDFISSYCDRWCERCAYTSRCSAFTAAAAIAMCDSVEEGLELAVGPPHPAGPEDALRLAPPWSDDFGDSDPVAPAPESAESGRRESERDARVRATPIMQLARATAMMAHGWLKTHHDEVGGAADDVVSDALAVVFHDAFFIVVKLNRALAGRDRHEHDGEAGDPVQNDWNGSAKVALISLERSVRAWRVIAEATPDGTPVLLADHLDQLAHQVDEAFPAARRFVRPGFDEPGRRQ